MSSPNSLVLQTRVLAIASHVVHGYVGNTMAAFVMQILGCEVAALNTVQYSNHTGYGQFKGTKASAQDIHNIYEGLKQSHLTDFDILLSGYAPSAEAVEAIGFIASDLKSQASTKPGSFFWILDPVMGDDGRLYVDDDVVLVYKNLLHDADLILPNQFEAELLSSTKITSIRTLAFTIATLHQTYRIPHIIITSVQLPSSSGAISIIGSTALSSFSAPRLFKIDVPALDCFFSGTGDMFAALILVRFREESLAKGLGGVKSWISPDEVEAIDLPLAKAAERVMGSMHAVLVKTKMARDDSLEEMKGLLEVESGSEKMMRLRTSKAAEVRVIQNSGDLKQPKVVWKAEALEEFGEGDE